MNTIMIQPKLSEVLEAQGKTMYWLAAETGIAYSTLHRLGKARAQSVDFRVLDLICDKLDCQPGDLLVRIVENGQTGAPAKKRASKKGN
jgi:putative transcriptional regulator